MAQLSESTVCILCNERILGTGFLISNNLIVTCAHVVESADDVGKIRFSVGNEIVSGQFLPDYFRDSNREDVAFFRLEKTIEKIIPVRLGAAEHSRAGSPFQAFGYPSVGKIQGIYARGDVLGILTEHNQLRVLQLNSSELNLGHSGAPVWDEQRGVVIGMVTSVYQATANGKLRDMALAIPSETIWQVCPEVRPTETCPYLGLDTFTEETARFFFGREELAGKLLSALRGGNRFLAIFGPSGSGKSSVVRAGLLPALKDGQLPGSRNWAQFTMRPANNPFEQMKAAGFDFGNIRDISKSQASSKKIVLFIDQFEELFILCSDEVRESFVHMLTIALEASNLNLVISMRDDFYSIFNSKATALAESGHLKIENVPGILKREDLVAMIERPAKQVGLAIEPGLIETIIGDLTRDGTARNSILPLLEFTLEQLWETRRGGTLTNQAYQAIGGVTGSLARWADAAYSELSKTERELAESLLTSLVHLGDDPQGSRDARMPRTLAELCKTDTERQVIQHLANRRLVVTSDETVELIHDRLMQEWERLKNWINTDRDNLRTRQGVIDAARQWELGGKKEGLLIHRGVMLELAIDMSGISRYRLEGKEREYLNTCRELRDQEIRAQEKNRRTRLNILTIALVVSIILASLAVFQGYQAKQQSQVAQERATELRNLAIVDQAKTLLKDHNPDLALALALYTSQGDQPADQAYSVLLDAVYLSLSKNVYSVCKKNGTDVAWVNSVKISPDAQWAAIGCFLVSQGEKTSSIYLLNLKTGGFEKDEMKYPARIFDLAISPDGKQILAGYDDSAVILWGVDGSKIYTLFDHSDAVSAVAFNSTGDRAVTISYDKSVIVWDIQRGEVISHISGTVERGNFPGKLTSVAFSPNGDKVAFGDEIGDIRIWDLGKNLIYSNPSNEKHSSFVLSILFSPDGSKIYSSSADSTIAIWDVSQKISRLNRVKASGYKLGIWINSLSLLPDNGYLLAGLSDGSILLWDITTLQVVQHLDGHLGEVVTLDVNSVGDIAISGARDGNLRIWDLTPFKNTGSVSLPNNTMNVPSPASIEITDLQFSKTNQLFSSDSQGYIHLLDRNHQNYSENWKVQPEEDPIASIDISPDDLYLLAGSANGQAVLWNMETQTASWQFNQRNGNVRSVDIGPDGKTAILGYENGQILSVDVGTGEVICALSGHTNAVNSVLISPDGKHAASGGNDHAVIWWDLNSCKKLKTLYQHDSWVLGLDFRPDGKQLASASADGAAIIWDLEVGRIVFQLKLPENEINPGLDVFMLSVRFSPDGRLLATSSANGSIGLWSVANGILLRKLISPLNSSCTLATHCFWIWTIKFSPLGDELWAGSADGSIYSWSILKEMNNPNLRTWIETNRFIYQPTTEEKLIYDITP